MLKKVLLGVSFGIPALAGIAWAGLQFPIKPFESPLTTARNCGSMPPSPDLPAPVARFVRAAIGEQVPIIETALVLGTARVNFNGLKLNTRFKFAYHAGYAHDHLIEGGWFGFPAIQVHERFQNNNALLDIPGNHVENDPNTNAASRQGLWAESIWLSPVWFTDPRVQWEAVDDTTAHLLLPDAAPEEAFTLHFDPRTGMLTELNTLRYQTPESPRLRWKNRILVWERINGVCIPVLSETQWEDNTPWARWQIDDVLYNVDVSAQLPHVQPIKA